MIRGSEGRFVDEDDNARKEGVVLFIRKDPKRRDSDGIASAPRGRDYTRKASPSRRDDLDTEIAPVSQHLVVLAMNKYPVYDGNPPSLDGRHEYKEPYIPSTENQYVPPFSRRSYRTPTLETSSNDSSPVTSPRVAPRQDWMEAWERAQGRGSRGLPSSEEIPKRSFNPRGCTVSPPRTRPSRSPAPRNVSPAPRQSRNASPARKPYSQTSPSRHEATASYRGAPGPRTIFGRPVDAHAVPHAANPLPPRARSQTPRRSQCDPHGVQGWSPWADPELRGKTPPRARTRTPPRARPRNDVETVALDSMRRDLYAARTSPTQAQKQKPPTGKTPTPNKPMAWASIPSPPQARSRAASSPWRGREQSVSPAPARFIDLGGGPVVPERMAEPAQGMSMSGASVPEARSRAVSEAVQTMSTSRAAQKMVATPQAPFFEPNPEYWETPPTVKAVDRHVPGVEASEVNRKATPKVLAYKGNPDAYHPRYARTDLPPASQLQDWDRILFDGDVSDRSGSRSESLAEAPQILSYTGAKSTISAMDSRERQQRPVALPLRDDPTPAPEEEEEEEDASDAQLSTLGRLRWQQWTHFPSSDSDDDDDDDAEAEPWCTADARARARPSSSVVRPRPSSWTASADGPATMPATTATSKTRHAAPARKATSSVPRKASPPPTRYNDLAERARDRCQQILRDKFDVQDEEKRARSEYKTRFRKQRPTVSRHALDERVQAVYEEAEAARSEVRAPQEAHRQLNFHNQDKLRRHQQAVRDDSDDEDAWLIIPRQYVKRSWPSERPLQRSPCPRMERVMAELLLHREDTTNVQPHSLRAPSPSSATAKPSARAAASPPPRLPATVGSWV